MFLYINSSAFFLFITPKIKAFTFLFSSKEGVVKNSKIFCRVIYYSKQFMLIKIKKLYYLKDYNKKFYCIIS